MSEWNDIIKADLADVKLAPMEPVADGKYKAVLGDVEAKTFKSGSKGLELTYVITDEGEYKGRQLKDWFVIRQSDGRSDKQGAARTKKLLIEAGLTPEQLSKFKFPEFDSKLKAGFKDILESAFVIEAKAQVQKKGVHAGKSFTRVIDYNKA